MVVGYIILYFRAKLKNSRCTKFIKFYIIYLMDINKSTIKSNLIKLVLFFSIALLSILLIMMSVSMLDLPVLDDPRGIGNSSASTKTDGNNKDIEKEELEYQGDGNNTQEEENPANEWEEDFNNQYGNIEEQFSDWKEKAWERKENVFNPSIEEYYAQGEQNKSFLPDADMFPDDFFEDTPNIDISGNQGASGSPFGESGSGGPGNSITASEEKTGHIPVFEVLGEPNYPFLKVMVMENYHKNRWIVSEEEEPELKLMIGVEMETEFLENSVKIKPIEPSSGNLPVLSGKFELKYLHALLKYEQTGTYVAENAVESFYEMVYSAPPTEEKLKYAKADSSYNYTLSYSRELESLLDAIIENSNSDYQAIKFVEEYLLQNYVLDNSIINNYGDEDGIETFLFGETAIGNSLDFLSSYTFILRAIGIPCRLVVGYRIDDTKPYQIVYGDQRYIYPEIKFKDYGWVPMDVFSSYPFYIPPETTKTEITYADAIAKRGTSINVKGTVKDSYGELLDGLQVLIYVKEDKYGPYLSYAKANVESGYFEVECDIKDYTGPGNYHVIADVLENDLYRTSSSDPELKVVTDTHLEIQSKNTIIGDKFKLEGTIIDAFSQEGLENFPININFKGADIFEEFYSEEDGRFTKNVKIDISENLSPEKNIFFAKKYKLSYQVSFSGTEYYYPSSVSGSLQVWQPIIYRILMGIIILLLLVPAIVFLLIKLRNTQLIKKQQLVLDGIKETVTMPSNNNFTIDRKTRISKLFIEFPYIKEKFPNVWGVGDGFLIRFVDDKGNFSEKQAIFHKKGKYKINILKDNISLASKGLDIVIYREEIISLGKTFLKDILGEHFEISTTMTLREIYLSLEFEITEEEYKVLEGMFVLLEKAVYSMEVVDRNDYEMFLTIIEKFRML